MADEGARGQELAQAGDLAAADAGGHAGAANNPGVLLGQRGAQATFSRAVERGYPVAGWAVAEG